MEDKRMEVRIDSWTCNVCGQEFEKLSAAKAHRQTTLHRVVYKPKWRREQ